MLNQKEMDDLISPISLKNLMCLKIFPQRKLKAKVASLENSKARKEEITPIL